MFEPELTPRERTARTERSATGDSVETTQAQVGRTALRPGDGEMGKWLSLAEAQRELGLALEEYVKYWAERGWLRNRRRPDGSLEISRADIMFQKRMREGLSAIGGRNLTPEELDELERDLPGTLPWEQAGADPSR